MARRKIKRVSKENDLKTMLRKPEVWVGLVTVTFLAIIAGNLVKGKIRRTLNQQTSLIVSPKPSTAAISLKPTLTVTPTIVLEAKKTTPTPAKKEAEKTIIKFAETSGYYEVKENDNYALISEKICGSQQWFEEIAYENGYQELYPGDKVIVNCGERE
jgi:hypothetical protein